MDFKNLNCFPVSSSYQIFLHKVQIGKNDVLLFLEEYIGTPGFLEVVQTLEFVLQQKGYKVNWGINSWATENWENLGHNEMPFQTILFTFFPEKIITSIAYACNSYWHRYIL